MMELLPSIAFEGQVFLEGHLKDNALEPLCLTIGEENQLLRVFTSTHAIIVYSTWQGKRTGCDACHAVVKRSYYLIMQGLHSL
jgi:hypothetical protein